MPKKSLPGPNCLICVFLGYNLKETTVNLKSAPSNFAKCNVLFKNENPQILNQFALLVCFWNTILKMFTFEINTREFVKLQSVIQTNKTLNVGQNIALFGNSQDGLCKKIIVLLEINTFKFIKNDFLTNAVNLAYGFSEVRVHFLKCTTKNTL